MIAGIRRQPPHPMRKESVVFGVAGIFFGLLVGWIIGSQQRRRTAPAAAAAPAQTASGAGAGRRRALDEIARRGAARRPPSAIRPTPRPASSSATSTSTPSATTTPCKWYEAALKLDPRRRQRQHRPRHQLLLHQPAGPGARAVRPLAGDRPEALQDAAERRHRPRLRQAGSRRRREGLAAGDRRRAGQRGGAAAPSAALDGLRSRPSRPGPVRPRSRRPSRSNAHAAASSGRSSCSVIIAPCRARARGASQGVLEGGRRTGATAPRSRACSWCAIRCAASSSSPSAGADRSAAAAAPRYFCSEKCRREWQRR